MMYQNGTLILCGANANGHYWKQFVAGEFSRRRLVALSADDGYKLWAKDANYRHRPILVGNKVLAEPWMFDLQTGEQQTRKHPITGEDVPWSIMRTGHHCGMLTGADSGMIMFQFPIHWLRDLEKDAGVRHFAGHRLGCWINAIPANGLVMIPKAARAVCVCFQLLRRSYWNRVRSATLGDLRFCRHQNSCAASRTGSQSAWRSQTRMALYGYRTRATLLTRKRRLTSSWICNRSSATEATKPSMKTPPS